MIIVVTIPSVEVVREAMVLLVHVVVVMWAEHVVVIVAEVLLSGIVMETVRIQLFVAAALATVVE